MICVSHAAVIQRTELAFWLRAGTHHRPEVHHGLVKTLDAFGRRDVLGDLPQAFLNLFFPGQPLTA